MGRVFTSVMSMLAVLRCFCSCFMRLFVGVGVGVLWEMNVPVNGSLMLCHLRHFVHLFLKV